MKNVQIWQKKLKWTRRCASRVDKLWDVFQTWEYLQVAIPQTLENSMLNIARYYLYYFNWEICWHNYFTISNHIIMTLECLVSNPLRKQNELYWWVPEGRNMSTINDEEALYQNLKNLSWTLKYLRWRILCHKLSSILSRTRQNMYVEELYTTNSPVFYARTH